MKQNDFVMERFTDYFLRYTADVPTAEIDRHQKFDRDCQCKPAVSFDDMNGWHTICHQFLDTKKEEN